MGGAISFILLSIGLLMILFPFHNDTTPILRFVWWSFLSRFLLLAILLIISTCSLLLLHLCAIVYCTLIYQVCQVTSSIFFFPSFNLSYIHPIAARHSSSLMAD